MKNAFGTIAANRFSRHFGGTKVGVADPYVTGYHFISFDLPTKLPSYLSRIYSGKPYNQMNTLKDMLAALCLSVTPPGGTLNKVEFTGLGGVKWAVPGNIDYGNEVSIKFLEMRDTPILDIMHGWVKMIRDYRVGASSEVLSSDTAGYSNRTYAGGLYYWTTEPDGKTIQYYAYYDGVFPNKDPQDLFTSDVESIGRLDIEIGFNVDHVWHEKWVLNKCQSYASTYAGDKNKIMGDNYMR